MITMKSNSKTSMLLKSIFVTGVLAGGLCAGASASDGEKSAVTQYVDDSVVTTEIKAKYVKSDLVDAKDIKVETQKGVVLLSGFVKTDLEKEAAEKIAKSVSGVRQVENTIAVKK
ncbi:MAG: BON domain-containing protein [Spongiibacteraceae bacterium]